jgi:selenocysteine-specific elongation factor
MTATRSDLVIGVAGHIDHGKTALVRALTGVDTDRLPEEKARGITIELGFAPLTLANGRRAAVIDMPGHERFVRTMISGAGGVDLMLLVVAANEGVMPQTREHLAIADLVGVRAGVVALTKCDLASPDIVELAADEIREVLRGSALENAPVIPVSAHARTGLDALSAALSAATVAPRDATGPALLPVDRVFVRKGFGVVVTGTLLSGAVRLDDAMLLGPAGPEHRTLPVRVRGLQVHGEAATEVHAGTRLAINLAGVELADVPRGAWLMHPAEVALSRSFDAVVTALPQTRRALARRTKLEVAAGATHALAGISLLEGESLEPGRKALARVTTDRPLALRPGERLVLRGPPSLAGVGSTVGGLVVVRPVAERVRRRAVALERARRAMEGDARERARVELEASAAKGLTRAELMARAGYRVAKGAALDGVVAVASDRYVGRAVLEGLQRAALQALSDHHGKHPAEKGLDRRALATLGDDAVVDHALQELVATSKITRAGDVIARAGWKPRGLDDIPYVAQVRASLARAGLAAPRVAEMATACGASPKELDAALKRLVELGHAVKVTSELYVDGPAMADLEARLVAYLEAKGTIDAQGFKELTGQSRKYAIPYAEHFDAKKVTLRIGDARKLRGR